jgi:hypothetical protein
MGVGGAALATAGARSVTTKRTVDEVFIMVSFL